MTPRPSQVPADDRLDPLLRPFVEAPDDAEAERELGILMEQHALPLARAIVARKFRSFDLDRVVRFDGQDRDDVVANAIAMLVDRLSAVRAGVQAAPIVQFLNYTAAVVHAACAHVIRRHNPERVRLKKRLYYIFTSGQELALWTTDTDERACGLSSWTGRSLESATRRAVEDAVRRAETRWSTLSRPQLTAAIVGVLRTGGGPIGFQPLVASIASAAGLVEPRQTDDMPALAARHATPELMLDQRRFMAEVWSEVVKLPAKQRNALLLNLRDETGAGLLWLLPITGVATIRQIADALEIPAAEFARLWRELPLDDASIAARLDCTRQQVINLRQSARKRLINRAGGVDSSALTSG